MVMWGERRRRGVSVEERVHRLGLAVPDYADPPYGERYGTLKAFHHRGRTLHLGGMTPESRQGVKVHPGRVGGGVTVAEGYQAARTAAINVLGLIRFALGSLDEVECFVQTTCYVATTPEFFEVALVSDGAHDLFLEVFGDPAARATSATVGVVGLSGDNVFEIQTVVQTRRKAKRLARA